MTTSQNPYTQMLVSYKADRFYGRTDQVTTILQIITGPEPTGHAIYGIRTIGKTTLLKFLKDERGAMVRYSEYVSASYRPGGGRYMTFVYLNFHSFSASEGSIFHLMLHELCDELMDEDRFHLEIELQMINPQMERLDIFKKLRKILQQLDDQYAIRITFLLDDFDVPLIKELVDDDDDRLLRTLSEHASLIIATEEPISLIRPDLGESSPLLGILRPEAISLLKNAEASELINHPVDDYGIDYSREEEDFLVSVGGKQPFTLTAACELYYNMRLDFPDIAEMLEKREEAARLRSQFILRLAGLPHVETILRMIWDKLTADEQQTLRQTSTGITAVTGSGRHASVATQLANKSLMYLDLRHGVYRIFSDLFAYFVSQQQPNNTYARTTKTIKQIRYPSEQALKKLSPIDRRLLDYFMDHPNRICTFDELLDAVWYDEDDKSKRALEASVYRLRRDLDGFGTIKNVRGKGYMFIVGDPARSAQH